MCEPVIWTSNDGSTWDLVSGESPFGPTAYVHDMAERDGRIVAVGRHVADRRGCAVGIERRPDLERDPTGTYQRIDRRAGRGRIAAGEAGWVALYGEAGTQEEVRAMYSLDGLEWVVDADELPDFWWAWGRPMWPSGDDQILVTYYDDVALVGEITR